MVEFRLVRARINRKQEVACLHLLALLEMNLVEIATNAGSDFNGLRRFEASDILVPLDHLASDWLDDGNDRRRRSGLRGVLPAAGHHQSDQERSDSKQVGLLSWGVQGFHCVQE